jgi:hypothetical protein
MTPSSPFEITRRRHTLNASGKYTNPLLSGSVAGTETAPRGLALGAHPTDEAALDTAQHNNFIGHLTRRVVVGGLSLADRVFGVTSAAPVGLESPFSDGLEVTVERAEEAEMEGTDYLWTSGTGAISASTPVPSSLSYLNGRLRVAQANEIVNYTLMANNLTPLTSGALRIRVVAAGN